MPCVRFIYYYFRNRIIKGRLDRIARKRIAAIDSELRLLIPGSGRFTALLIERARCITSIEVPY
jgi:hypothetical protein